MICPHAAAVAAPADRAIAARSRRRGTRWRTVAAGARRQRARCATTPSCSQGWQRKSSVIAKRLVHHATPTGPVFDETEPRDAAVGPRLQPRDHIGRRRLPKRWARGSSVASGPRPRYRLADLGNGRRLSALGLNTGVARLRCEACHPDGAGGVVSPPELAGERGCGDSERLNVMAR